MPVDQKALELRLRTAWRFAQREQGELDVERHQAPPPRASGPKRGYGPPRLGRPTDRGSV
jgi:hypothetical protein